MNSQPKPPPSLEEARNRLQEQILELFHRNDYGPKLGKHPAWQIISLATVFPSFDIVTNPYSGVQTDLRPRRLRELGEWIQEVIRTKNAGRELEELAACLKAKPAQSRKASTDLAFANALSSFLNAPLGTAPESSTAIVPTLGQIRRRLGRTKEEKRFWHAEQVRKVAHRLGWQDLVRETGGRPRKPSPEKRKSR